MVKLARLRDLRERKALTQQELAAKASVSRVTVSRLENGRDEALPTTVRKLANALGVEPKYLCTVDSRPDRGQAPPLNLVREALSHPRLEVRDRQGVTRQLRQRPELASILVEAANQLATFVPDARLTLELLPDPDYGEGEQLFLGVTTSLDEAEALQALRHFDREWWVHHVPRTGGLLCIDLSDQ